MMLGPLKNFAWLAALSIPLFLTGCGSSSSTSGGSGNPGEDLATMYACASCHSPTNKVTDLSGQKSTSPAYASQYKFYGPNLTPDMATGIGSWSDAQLKAALEQGKKKDGSQLCVAMPIFGTPCDINTQTCDTISDSDVTEIISYLRSLKPVSNKIPLTDSQCMKAM